MGQSYTAAIAPARRKAGCAGSGADSDAVMRALTSAIALTEKTESNEPEQTHVERAAGARFSTRCSQADQGYGDGVHARCQRPRACRSAVFPFERAADGQYTDGRLCGARRRLRRWRGAPAG